MNPLIPLAFIGVLIAFIKKKKSNAIRRQIDEGEAAMRRLIRTGTDQLNAMHREGLGDIDFLWGVEKFGAKHVLKRRAEQVKKFGGQNGEKILLQAPTVIMRAPLPANPETHRRIELSHDGYHVVLSNESAQLTKKLSRARRKQAAKTIRARWVFTAYDISDIRGGRNKKKAP
jgi:hypothetical protein